MPPLLRAAAKAARLKVEESMVVTTYYFQECVFYVAAVGVHIFGRWPATGDVATSKKIFVVVPVSKYCTGR